MIHPKFLISKRDDKINSAYMGFLLTILDELLWKRHMSILIILVNLFNGISAKNVLLYEAYGGLHHRY